MGIGQKHSGEIRKGGIGGGGGSWQFNKPLAAPQSEEVYIYKERALLVSRKVMPARAQKERVLLVSRKVMPARAQKGRALLVSRKVMPARPDRARGQLYPRPSIPVQELLGGTLFPGLRSARAEGNRMVPRGS